MGGCRGESHLPHAQPFPRAARSVVGARAFQGPISGCRVQGRRRRAYWRSCPQQRQDPEILTLVEGRSRTAAGAEKAGRSPDFALADGTHSALRPRSSCAPAPFWAAWSFRGEERFEGGRIGEKRGQTARGAIARSRSADGPPPRTGTAGARMFAQTVRTTRFRLGRAGGNSLRIARSRTDVLPALRPRRVNRRRVFCAIYTLRPAPGIAPDSPRPPK